MTNNIPPSQKSPVPLPLNNKIAFVTGGAGGIGAAVAKGLASSGAHVVVVDLQESAAAETVLQIKAAGGRANAYALDVTNQQDCRALAEKIRAELGPVSILFNNAGVQLRDGGIGAVDVVRKWHATMAVNVDGPFLVTHAFLTHLKETKGCVVNVASINSFVGQQDNVAYPPSKAAVALMTKTLAMELAKDGIRVNAVAPGMIKTNMSQATRENPQALERFIAHVPMKRFAEPEEMVGPVLFLCSDAASYVTGVVLPVDGGYLA